MAIMIVILSAWPINEPLTYKFAQVLGADRLAGDGSYLVAYFGGLAIMCVLVALAVIFEALITDKTVWEIIDQIGDERKDKLWY